MVGADQSSSCSIDINCTDPEADDQNICRICLLSAKEADENAAELIELGCGCKGELGLAHVRCAEAWFRSKGNRLCEICGDTAKNIRDGVSDNGFMEEWAERRAGVSRIGVFDGSGTGCMGAQRLCNLIMACLVLAFVLPWFFRVNIF
ncbi:hypothetical protein Salat_0341900 [Sesamum alatum]|uniref:RING-CH-type domain-containing protein n=1 Tax=Sesamum alatum TaxID=300844 RepID=A0AAE1Z0J8_9LAMI|nr:hypothetical protein Salat_0341900 [Sesamum alatum]